MRSAAGADPCGPIAAHVDLGVEGPCFAGAGEGPPGKSPRTPSVVFERASRNLHALIPWSLVDSHEPGAPFRLLPIRAPRQAGLRTSFRLAPSGYRPTLRSTDREDARCDEPTSATQSNHVHPHLARSRLRAPLARRGHPAESWAPRSDDRGTRRFTTSVTASAGRRTTLDRAPLRFPLRVQQRGRCLPTAPCATEPLTPLSRSCCRLPPLPPSRELRPGRASSLQRGLARVGRP
jgi:hypothetical protein